MPKGTPAGESVGARIRTLRERREWSGRFLASRMNINPSTLSRIERGERSANNRYLIQDLAAALECSVTDITGQPYAPADRELETAHARVHTLRTVLVNAASDEPPATDRTAQPMPVLEQLFTHVDARWDDHDYAALGDLLTQIVPDLHAHGHAGDRRAVELLLDASRAAMVTFTGLGYPGDAWMAAERCWDSAQWLDDPVGLVVSELVRSFAAVRCVGYQRAGTVTDRAIDAIQPHLAEPGALSLLGTLHLTATHAAMGQHQPEQAFAHQAEAEAIAKRTGETRSWRLPFGPANVNVWRMGLEIDAGRHGKAVEVAASTATLGELPACRQSEFYLELARGLAGDRDGHDRAIRALLTAERLTPQKIRSSPSARETAHDLRESARRASVGSALRGLCERVGLPD